MRKRMAPTDTKIHVRRILQVLWDLMNYSLSCFAYMCYGILYFALTVVHAGRTYIADNPKYETSAQIESILWKRKFSIINDSAPSDFLTLPGSDVHPNTVLRPNVSIYCVTRIEAIFVEIPENSNIYQSDINPFLYIGQFKEAIRVIRMPMSSLHRLTEEIGNPKVPVIWLSNTGRCGSTILGQVFERVPGSLLFGEPDSLTNLGMIRKVVSSEEYEGILVSIIRILCKPHPDVSRICIKTRSCASIHVAGIAKHFPEIYQLFIYRNSQKTVSSFLGAMLSMSDQRVYRYFIDNDFLSRIFPFFRRRIYYDFCFVLDKTPPFIDPVTMNTVEHFANAWAACLSGIQMNIASGVKIIPILYEDMIKDRRRTCSTIFSIVDIDQSHVDEAVKAFQHDSQENSVLSIAAIRNDPRRNVSKEDKYKADLILAKYGLPNLAEPLVLPNLLKI